MTTVKRIKKELEDIKKSKSPHFTVEVDKNNMYKWNVTLIGPPDTPYEGGHFKLDITLPDTYPFKPPQIRFVTKVYHPNISDNGGICLDILGSSWSAALTMAKVLLSLSSFLENPSSNHGLRPKVYEEYSKDKELFNQHVREQTRLHAMGHLTDAEKDAIQKKGNSETDNKETADGENKDG